MSEEHKTALAEGRDQGRSVRLYLEALDANKPRRGRKRTRESITKRLDAIETELPTVDPLKRLHLIQERLDLRSELETGDAGADLTELEAGFVAVAASYGERKGITYSAWRELGVPAAVLTRASITRAG
jgi:hypothetical protein